MINQYSAKPYSREYLEKYTPREVEKEDPNWKEDVHELAVKGVTTVIFYEDVPIMFLGHVVISPGVAECWSLIGEEMKEDSFFLTRFVSRYVDSLMALYKWRRFQCVVDSNYPDHERFVQLLGFQKEGLMRKLGPMGQDMWLYSRVV